MIASKHIFALFFCLACFIAHAQWTTSTMEEFASEILKIENRIPEEASYSYKAHYSFFEQENSNDTVERMQIELIFNAKRNALNFSQLDKFIVQTDDIQITCDTAYRTLILNYPNPTFFSRKSGEDFKQIAEQKSTVKKRSMGDYEIFHLDFESTNLWKAAEIWFDKKGMVKKYILWTGQPILDDSGSENKIIQPRMEVLYSDFQIGPSADKKQTVGVEHYFSDIKNKVLQPKYSGFKVVDLREEK
jgi:hypothetical protein